MKSALGINPPDPKQVCLITGDGYPISARLFRSDEAARARIIVAGATGVPQKFYQAFAQFASSRGYETLTLDYRGIGLSKPETLKGFRMDYLDWAHQDIAAAVEYMHTEATPLYMVGHSFGGHAFGLLPNHTKVNKFYTFATGAGWHGWMPKSEQIKVQFLWKIIGPLLVRWNGYLAWSKLGMGEDLPQGVFRDWKHWCQFPRYFFDDPAMASIRDKFGSVRTPIMAANAVDDLWAMPSSRDAFMSGYPTDIWQGVDIDPATLGLKSIGHMGYFRRQAQPLWRDALAWFEKSPVP
jgi:predicted alpha/beta hydrolase